jgi:UDP-2,3-diacylglucosamine hydrolase
LRESKRRADAAGVRPTWILADAHAGASPEADRELCGLLDRAALEGVDLLLLGDLFLGWIAPERFWTPLQREVLEKLRRLHAARRTIRFVVGNRDYLVKKLEPAIFDAVYEGDTVIDLGGVPTLVSHGDLVRRDDRAYRAWRRVSRSVPAKMLLGVLPGAAGRLLAERTERAFAKTNLAYKTGALPLVALEALGRRARALGADRVLVGHFHHDRVLDVREGAPVVLAPAWLEHRRILRAMPGARELESVDYRTLVR